MPNIAECAPCPWCGAEASVARYTLRAPDCPARKYRVCCMNDECWVGPYCDHDTEAEAIAAWNRRPASAPPAPAIAADMATAEDVEWARSRVGRWNAVGAVWTTAAAERLNRLANSAAAGITAGVTTAAHAADAARGLTYDIAWNDAMRECAQIARDQYTDHPSLNGDWNVACEHVRSVILRSLKVLDADLKAALESALAADGGTDGR